MRSGRVLAVVVGACGLASCADAPRGQEGAVEAARVASLGERFGLRSSAVARFEPIADTHVRAIVAGRTRVPARVDLPVRANDVVRLEDETSKIGIGFRLEGAREVPLGIAKGWAIYPGALDGADVVHRVHGEGTEDFVFYQARPAREELRYRVDVSKVAGLRLVSNTLELQDAHGSPVLRVAPPYVVDSNKARHVAQLAVSGCAYDADPRAPWDRPVTRPGANECIVHVSWNDVVYPAMVDPAWTTTGSMAIARESAEVGVLASGRVLVAGGGIGPTAAEHTNSVELFDPAANGGVGAFAAAASTKIHHWGNAIRLPSGKMLLAGSTGRGSNGCFATDQPYAEIYDPATGTCSDAGALGTENYLFPTPGVLPSGKVLFVGFAYANNCGPYGQAAFLFDPADNSWTPTGAPLRQERNAPTFAMLASGKVLVSGGRDDGEALNTAEIYDPATGAFTPTGTMTYARVEHTATVLPSGKVLVAGGMQAPKQTMFAPAEIFDPSGDNGKGTFNVTAPMVALRTQPTATLLPSGKVLIAGGYDPVQAPFIFDGAELFDPKGNGGLGTFTATTSMSSDRWRHTMVTLPSGKAFVVGGFHYDPGALAYFQLASAEIYEEPIPPSDGGPPDDGGTHDDGSIGDAGPPADSGSSHDAGPADDAGPHDAGPPDPPHAPHCTFGAPSTGASWPLPLAAIAALFVVRRRRR